MKHLTIKSKLNNKIKEMSESCYIPIKKIVTLFILLFDEGLIKTEDLIHSIQTSTTLDNSKSQLIGVENNEISQKYYQISESISEELNKKIPIHILFQSFYDALKSKEIKMDILYRLLLNNKYGIKNEK